MKRIFSNRPKFRNYKRLFASDQQLAKTKGIDRLTKCDGIAVELALSVFDRNLPGGRRGDVYLSGRFDLRS
ncbi:MAG: hypothetical protein EAZ24_02530 [Burkholderiales bacterium]|nr:MAG: hypothetical protein EAZ21_02880 [Betaproteobacteria bacterium]TAG83892.1 MAG: hypothetical protein EAZ24_02530 [Burkholderiales bacterium]